MDGMRSPSPPEQPSIPQLQPFQEAYAPQPASESQHDGRSRASSGSRSDGLQQPVPIREAVNTAFDSSQAAAQADPMLVAQITQEVIKNLAASGLVSPAPPPQQSQQPFTTQHSHAPPPTTAHAPRSPTTSTSASIPSDYTPPPSPLKRHEHLSNGASSPDFAPSETGSNFSFASKESRESRNTSDTPRPSQADTSAYTKSSSRAPRRDRRSSESMDQYDGQSTQSRTRAAPVPEEMEETTLERIWQPLFDRGKPLPRLGEFLRGIAIHIIEDYEPKHSIVVTPHKLLAFLNHTKVQEELYPWQTIFGGGCTCASISLMYRKLLCQHHLVQAKFHEVPTIPGLTPLGFSEFVTVLIEAHPDIEFDRLAKAVLDMPISNADNKTERFPKELSRRLLPRDPNSQAEQRLIAAFSSDPVVKPLLRNTNQMPPPPAQPPQSSSFSERERTPYNHRGSAVDDEDLLATPSMPIERERKPYTAKEGTGKFHADDSRPVTSQYRPEGSTRPSRAASTLPAQTPFGGASSDPRNIPPPTNRGPRMSTAGNGTIPVPRRGSPPPRNAYARSDPINVGDIPASQYASNLHAQYAANLSDDPEGPPLRRYDSRRQQSSLDDESSRGKPIPQRNAPGPGPGNYDYGGSSLGGPPVGSYGVGGPPFPSFDDRRRSTMGSISGGTDGYGSFNGGYTSQQPPYGSSRFNDNRP